MDFSKSLPPHATEQQGSSHQYRRQTQLARAAVSKPLRLTLRPGAVLKNHQSESTVGGCRR